MPPSPSIMSHAVSSLLDLDISLLRIQSISELQHILFGNSITKKINQSMNILSFECDPLLPWAIFFRMYTLLSFYLVPF